MFIMTGFLTLLYSNTPYPIFFYTLHTRTYFFHIQLFPVKGVKGTSFEMVEAQRAALVSQEKINNSL